MKGALAPRSESDLQLFLEAFDDQAQIELRGDVREGSTRRAATYLLPTQESLVRIATNAELGEEQVRALCIELWREFEELRLPNAAGSRDIAEATIRGLLGLSQRNRRAEDFCIVAGALVLDHGGQEGALIIEDDREYLAAKAYVLLHGGSFFRSYDEYAMQKGRK